jgi:hypothetical protein
MHRSRSVSLTEALNKKLGIALEYVVICLQFISHKNSMMTLLNTNNIFYNFLTHRQISKLPASKPFSISCDFFISFSDIYYFIQYIFILSLHINISFIFVCISKIVILLSAHGTLLHFVCTSNFVTLLSARSLF